MSTSAPTTNEKRPIRLGWEEGAIVVASTDEGRFEQQVRGSLAACRDGSSVSRTIERFKSEFLPLVRRWCEAHRELVRSCYIPMSSRPLCVFVVSRKTKYDFSLSDPAADLEMELFRMNWPVEVLHVPSGSPESLRSLFDPTDSVEVYGDAG